MELSARDMARFWAKVQKSPKPEGCWLWLAGAWSSGEPAFYLHHRFVSARRIAYVLRYGMPYPDKALRLYPPCYTKRCLAHLTPPAPTAIPALTPRDLIRFWVYIERHDDPDACWPWRGPVEQQRYPIFQVQYKKWRPAVLFHLLTHGPLPEGMHAIHDPACTNPFCVRHTIVSTKKSTHLRINTTHTKLTRDQVIALRKDYATGHYTLKDLAEIYGLRSAGHVSEIVHRLAFTTIP